MIANFHVTAMCDDCQNALIGIVRQGFVCQRKRERIIRISIHATNLLQVVN